MSDAPLLLSLAYRTQIDEVCKQLPQVGLQHVVMYIVFNDGSTFILSNAYSILKSYYLDELHKEDYTCTQPFIQPHEKGYYLCSETQSLSTNLHAYLGLQHYYPIFNLIRPHTECTFIFSAITKNAIEDGHAFYNKIGKRFETFCINFVDCLLDLIIQANPNYRFSFIFSNKSLRDAVIKQGYPKDIKLTPRDKECLWYAFLGRSVKEIAQLIQISPYSVEEYLKRIKILFNTNRIPEIMVECMHRGIFGKLNYFDNQHYQFAPINLNQQSVSNAAA